MSDRRSHDLAEDPDRWDAWAARAADGLGLPPGHVDVPTLHRIATVVARRVERPLVPVTTYLVGRALEHDPALTLEEATARIERLAQEGPLTEVTRDGAR
ncbi:MULTISPECIES: DUF6457 domain-containing protein [Kytococcus]|uniref:DUF6457 domain-containing protein n=1 Tax=Kytococcus TaxID=57499 RepID=UPI0008A4ED7E|nr:MULTISPECIES: DUF6457 domain-containing protein [Kytococcus]OFS10188.1 hypothetical protein HMPREF3099_08845 [Kytococcus sp. HMSC28H12]